MMIAWTTWMDFFLIINLLCAKCLHLLALAFISTGEIGGETRVIGDAPPMTGLVYSVQC